MKRKKYDVKMGKRIRGKEEGGRWLGDAAPPQMRLHSESNDPHFLVVFAFPLACR